MSHAHLGKFALFGGNGKFERRSVGIRLVAVALAYDSGERARLAGKR